MAPLVVMSTRRNGRSDGCSASEWDNAPSLQYEVGRKIEELVTLEQVAGGGWHTKRRGNMGAAG